ncbi:hypothetical protein GF325_15480 [Candidatus Bathyarchaeota archaeon]|nr:hypothetical protein [Candidatus Bathyarchaeota archaeon]
MVVFIAPGVIIGGLSIALASTFFLNLGPAIQKTAFQDMSGLDARNLKESMSIMFSSKKWILGFILLLLGAFLYSIAVDMMGIVVVQPLLNFGITGLVIIARRTLNENLDAQGKFGIVLVVIMPVFITLGGASEPELLTGDMVVPLLIYTLIFLGGAGACLIVTRRFPLAWAIIVGIVLGVAAQYVQWFMNELFAVGNVFNGFINGIIPFLVMASLNLLAALYLTQIGLQENQASRFVPIRNTVNLMVTIIGGIFLFNQHLLHPIFYFTGLAIGIVSIFLLGKFNAGITTDQEDDQSVQQAYLPTPSPSSVEKSHESTI